MWWLIGILLLLPMGHPMTVVWTSSEPLTFEATLVECEARKAVMCSPRDNVSMAMLNNAWTSTVCRGGELRNYYTNVSLHTSCSGVVLQEQKQGACCVLEVLTPRPELLFSLLPTRDAPLTRAFGVLATLCPKGHSCAGMQASPAACASGTFANAQGASSCDACQPGTYAASVASYQCQVCPPGTYTSLWRSGSCSPCVQGTYTIGVRSEPCPLCPLGAYCPDPSLGSAQCPAHTYTAERGMVTKLSCLCQDGYACTYVRRVVVTLVLSSPVDTLTIVQALALAARVSPDKVTVLPHGRRLLNAVVTIHAVVMGVSRIDQAPIGLPIKEFRWEVAHWVTPRPSLLKSH